MAQRRYRGGDWSRRVSWDHAEDLPNDDFGWEPYLYGFHGPYTGIGPRGYYRSDERIRDDICERMTQHGQLDASNMEVQVHQGEVTLTGTARNRQEKRLAEDLAESVTGVNDVHNQLRLSSLPGGGVGRLEDVHGSGVYPASGPLPEGDAEVRGMAAWGQGERGAEGYKDHGDSELRISRTEEQNKEPK